MFLFIPRLNDHHDSRCRARPARASRQREEDLRDALDRLGILAPRRVLEPVVVPLLASASEESRRAHRTALRTPRRGSEVAREGDRDDLLAGIPAPDSDPPRRLLPALRAAGQDPQKVGGGASAPGRSPCREARHQEPVVGATLDISEALEMLGTPPDRERDGIHLAGGLDASQQAGDRTLWELVASPENTSVLGLRERTRRRMDALQRALATKIGGLRLSVTTSGMGTCVGRCDAPTSERPDLASRERIPDAKLLPKRHALATAALSLHTEHAAEAARYTSFDATLEAPADGARRVSVEGPIPDAVAARGQRLLLLQRLAFLRDRELARRVRSVTFERS